MQKSILFLMLLLFTVFTTHAQDVMVVNDKNAELRTASGFHGIHVSNAIDLVIKQGNEEAVVVSAVDEKYRNRIKTEVKNGILRIWFDNDGLKWNWNMGDKKLRAYVSVKNIDIIQASGACDVKIDGNLNGTELKLNLSGASSFKGNINYSKLVADQSGASDVNISGKVNELNVSVSGASDFKGFELITETCVADASGASDIKITVNKDLKVQASGASDVDYKGNAVISKFNTSGASSVRKRSK